MDREIKEALRQNMNNGYLEHEREDKGGDEGERAV